jgi:protein SCO1/2
MNGYLTRVPDAGAGRTDRIMKRKFMAERSAGLLLIAVAFSGFEGNAWVLAQSEIDSQSSTRASIPEVELVNQDGKTVHLYTDLTKGRVAVLSFIFTTCGTTCPLVGANLGRLQTELGQLLGKQVALISVSVDPVTDTPERLKAWAVQFDAKPGWSLLTGDKGTVDGLLKKLGVFTPDIQNHSPFLLLVDDRTGDWTRVNALETSPAKIAAVLRKMLQAVGNRAPDPDADRTSAIATTGDDPRAGSPVQRYFGDVELTDQDGKQLRLYTDILKGNVVIINSFFSTCSGVCKVTIPVMKELQENFGDRVGREIRLVSITVDPEIDTPAVLKRYADGIGAKSGWEFLTGHKQAVDQVLYKLGFYVDAKEDHSNIFIVGNEPTGLWKKVLGVAPPDEIRRVIQTVVDDRR